MAIIALNSTAPEVDDRSYGAGATHVETLGWVANTSAAYIYFAAPFAGKLTAMDVGGTVTSDGTKTYTFTCINLNNSSAAMIGTTLYDASPVLTAGTSAAVVISATAANLVVAKGDLIKVGMAGGTGSGLASAAVTFEPTA
jgi:hypothetical protein